MRQNYCSLSFLRLILPSLINAKKKKRKNKERKQSVITNIHVELNFQISFLFPQPALLRAVICKKGVLCSRPRIKFIHVTFKSILTWEGNNRIVGGCSPEQQGPTSEGLTLLGEPCLTLSVIITQMWLQKLWSVTFLSRFTVSVCGVQRYIFVFFFPNRGSAR